MAREREVKVTILGDASGAQKALGQVESATGQTESKFSKMGSTIAKAVGTGVLLNFANDAKNMASDVAEAGSKVGVVFGENRAAIDQFAATSAKAFGISKGAALEAAGTFGNLFVATGLTKGAAADMSVETVKLAADLGSFNNLGTDEVLEKLRSGLVGEVEPLRALGVNFNAAAVEAKAMEMGLVDANGEISEGAKVQARYALILEQTKNAQGDFSRTADGMANSSKIAAASAQDTSASFGKALAPAMAKANKLMIAGLELFNELPGALQQVTIGLGMATAAVTLLGGRTAAWTAITKVAAAAQAAFNFVLSANPIGLVVIALAALAAGLVYAYNHSETFREAVKTLGSAFVFMKDVALDAIAWVVDKWLAAAEWIVRGAAKAFGWMSGLGPKLKEAAGWIEGFRDEANAFLSGIRGEIAISADASEFWAELDRARSAAQRGVAIQYQEEGGSRSTPGPQRFHDGGIVGGHGEVPILAQAGEGVFTRGQMAALGVSASRGGGDGASTVVNVYVAGSVMTEHDIVEAVQAGLLQKQRRVPSLGLT